MLAKYSTLLAGLTFLIAIACPLAEAQLTAPTVVEMNLGPIPFDKYTTTDLGTSVFPNCPAGSSVRSCMQSQLASYYSQGVRGVRFQFGICGAAYSTMLSNCGNAPATISVNPAWQSRVSSFFADVYASGMRYVTPTPSYYGFGSETGTITSTITDPCFGGTKTFTFEPAAPFGQSPYGVPHGLGYNQAYNCSPANPVFVGWQNLQNGFNAMLQAASSNSLNLREFDLLNEIQLVELTVLYRLLVDNKHTSTGNPDMIDSMRYYLGQNGFSAAVLTYSAFASRSNSSGYDCSSVFGDSARIVSLSTLVSSIAGGLAGSASSRIVNNGLGCGGSTAGMLSLPYGHTQPTVIDIHVYPCVEYTYAGRCDLSQSSSILANEAKTEFNAVRAFMNSFGPSGWRGYNSNIYNSLFIAGEVHSKTSVPMGSFTVTCEDAPDFAPSSLVSGFNSSNLAGTSMVLRPWNYPWSSCYPIPTTVNPPYRQAP
jgi:hypothetical protein